MQSLPVAVNLLKDLGAVETDPGFLAEGEHFPQGNTEHPGIRGVAETGLNSEKN